MLFQEQMPVAGSEKFFGTRLLAIVTILGLYQFPIRSFSRGIGIKIFLRQLFALASSLGACICREAQHISNTVSFPAKTGHFLLEKPNTYPCEPAPLPNEVYLK